MKQYVIIGGGIAAAGCIEGIRSIDADSPITLISSEERSVYCRPLISYYLEGRTDIERMKYRPDDFYDRMNCSLLLGRTAVSIDADAGLVTLDDGSALSYTELCLAAGSSPFVPHFEGIDTVEKRFSFMTMDDALALEEALTPSSRVLIIGAGLIGLKCAEGILERAGSVTVCDLADHILPSILDASAAQILQQHLEAHGITFMLEDTAVSFEGNTAHMRSGSAADFDILVTAVGVRPNTSLLSDIGGAVGRGILVDEYMATSVPGIRAAGDCTEGMDVSSGHSKVLAILPNAYMQGHAAGVNMAGGREAFDKGIPMNSIGFFGMHAMTAGTYEGDVYEERTDSSLKRLYTADGLLKGYMLIGRDERAGIYTSLIRERTPLSELNFDLLKEAAGMNIFSEETRRKKLGGKV